MANINDLIGQQVNPNSVVSQQAPQASPIPQAPMNEPAAGPQEMATPEQKEELKRLFAGVQGANSKLVSQDLMGRNQNSIMRQELVQKLFELMQQAGVDPNDPAAIKAFLQQLEQQDPDLLEMFEVAFRGLAGNEQVPGGSEGMMQGGMNGEMPEEDNTVQERFQNLSRMEQ
ncbi:hypothetical protein M0R04_06655 [Candidatus Dojkabacteria bacterium]|jgi:ribosomal protein L12E/L44/L45/RPP1/RPP2|nr:hypothetical protein [Candidatus Dojkabacteria bacterium]